MELCREEERDCREVENLTREAFWENPLLQRIREKLSITGCRGISFIPKKILEQAKEFGYNRLVAEGTKDGKSTAYTEKMFLDQWFDLSLTAGNYLTGGRNK